MHRVKTILRIYFTKFAWQFTEDNEIKNKHLTCIIGKAHLNPVLVAERWYKLDMAELYTEKFSTLQATEILEQKAETLTEETQPANEGS